MPLLCQITVPGLDVPADWRTVHDRLLDDFPEIDDVLPTTIGGTVLIVYDGRSQVDRWLESVSGSIAARRAGFRVHDRAS